MSSTSSTPDDTTLKQVEQENEEFTNQILNELCLESALCDVTLKTTDGDGIHVHKCVLASNSVYFEKMFNGAFKETDEKLIHIKYVRHAILQHLMDYIYTGRMVTIDDDNVQDLFDGADLFQLSNARKLCIEYFMKVINNDNCLAIRNIADSRMLTALSNRCLKHALTNFDLVSQTDDFLGLPFEQITELIQSDYLRTEQEYHVFEAIMRWVKHEEYERKKYLPELMSLLRLEFISLTYFFQVIKTDPLIKSNLKCMERLIKSYELYNTLEDTDEFDNEFIIASKPRMDQKVYSASDLPRIRCSDPSFPGYGENAIDLSASLSRSIPDFQKIEWAMLMNEENFLREWDEEWIGLFGSQYSKGYSDDW